MDPDPLLVELDDKLTWAALRGDRHEYIRAVDSIVDFLDSRADPERHLMEFDDLVHAKIDRLVDAGNHDLAEDYATAVQDLYDMCELPAFSAWLGLRRAELAIISDRPNDAEQLAREAHDLLAGFGDAHRTAGATMLGRALGLQGRFGEAVAVFEGVIADAAEGDVASVDVAEATEMLGYVLKELNRPVEAAERFRAAAQLWRELGGAAEADDASREVAAIDVGLAVEAAGREQFEESGLYAAQALDAAVGRDERLEAAAAVVLAMSRLRLGDPHGARDLARGALPVLGREGDHAALATAHLVLGETLGRLGDLVGADASLRAAAVAAERAGDTELATQAARQLAALGDERVGADLTLGVFSERSDNPEESFAAVRRHAMNALQAGNPVLARHYFEQALDQAAVLDDVGQVMSLHATLMLTDLADGRHEDAARRWTVLDEAIDTARRHDRLPAEVLPFLELWRGLAAIGSADWPGAERAFAAACDLFRANDATLYAAVAEAVLGALALQLDRSRLAADHLVTAVLTLRSGLVTLPNSAERAIFYQRFALFVDLAVRAVAATGDHHLMSELLEELHAQSMPQPLMDEDSVTRSLAAILTELGGAALGGFRIGKVAGAQDGTGRPTSSASVDQKISLSVEQESNLTVPVGVVMPWGSVALERFRTRSRQYGGAVVPDRAVVLEILR